ncbi:O-antigen polymerase [Colwellia sp. MB02u-14]|uniref:O-antigen polymerase n=1 Tax=Colwellia sp. MB02u-14 TaxID=2759815 RepID=UPI0015F4459C|nr:O-antigen polymerase [Colwellia sp. MB02u-14]MBA6303752.1 oligosaccharide repeat unit polymerase [Colwellia sp. MB02u-14]
MFSIRNYELSLLFLTLILFLSFFLILFKNKYTSILDPLVYHLLWISTFFSFLCSYIFELNNNIALAFYFLMIMVLYVFLLFLFIQNINRNKDVGELLEYRKVVILWAIMALLFFISKYSMFEYFLNNPPISWFLYRYQDLTGRNPVERILSTSTSIFLFYYSFLLIFIYKRIVFYVAFVIVLILSINILGGGRSSLIQFLLSLGMFAYYFYEHFSASFFNKINFYGVILVCFSILIAIFVTSFYDSGLDPIYVILNRVIANADGVEYYLKFDGAYNIESSVIAYVKSTFGIFISPIVGSVKNVGWQLTELVTGFEASFAQGSNFSLPLQIMVFPYYLSIFYVFIITYIVSYFRNLCLSSNKKSALKYYLSNTGFIIATDVEYWVFTLFCGVLLYLFIIYFFERVKI